MKAPAMEVGNYPVRLVRIIDLGVTKNTPWKPGAEVKAPSHKISVTYEFVTEFMKDEDGNDILDKPRWMSETFNFHSPDAERSTCAKRYLGFDPSNINDGDWEALLGAAGTATVVPKPKAEGTKVGAISPPMKGFEVAPLVNEPYIWTLEDPDMEVFESFPEWLQEEIKGGVGEMNIKFCELLESYSYEAENDDHNREEEQNGSEDNPY
jgi:hypothetical protein